MEVSSKDKKVTSWDNYPLISTADFYFFSQEFRNNAMQPLRFVINKTKQEQVKYSTYEQQHLLWEDWSAIHCEILLDFVMMEKEVAEPGSHHSEKTIQSRASYSRQVLLNSLVRVLGQCNHVVQRYQS